MNIVLSSPRFFGLCKFGQMISIQALDQRKKRVTKAILTLSLLFFSTNAGFCQAQTTSAPPVPASTNVPGAEYPNIDSESRVTFRFHAPDAKSVGLQLDKRYAMVRDQNGDWSVTTGPQVPGFHYYWLVVDGQMLNDPASETFFGVGKQTSGVEIPEKGVDFYDVKDVPHGEIRERWYFSKTTGASRRIFVYTPPGYDADTGARYPVLYLQHGGGEDERAWGIQGHVNLIMDNLIAEKKAVPMIIVMEKGSATKPGEASQVLPFGGGPRSASNNRGAFMQAFEDVVIKDLIPMVDSTYRTIPDRDHRAMAGLSMGGMQTFQVTMNHLDMFAYIGGFSGAGGRFGPPGAAPLDIAKSYNGVFADSKAFNNKVKLLWVGVGTAEPKMMHDGIIAFHQALDQAGIKHIFYESPGTAHEWQTWRRDLKEFAPLLFQ
jgi:enterochelin esterase-like enzyme